MKRIAVDGYKDRYEIQEDGKLFSKARIAIGNNGVEYLMKPKEILPASNKSVQYLQVSLWKTMKAQVNIYIVL